MHSFPSSRAAALLCLTLLLNGCKRGADKDDAADATATATAVSVAAQHPTIGPLSEEIAADAILAPLSQAAIAPRISAPIRAEYVQRGAHVRKGQLLLTLESRDLQGSALDSKGAFTSAQASFTTAVQATIPEDLQKAQLDVDGARANLDVANRTADERKRLLSQGAIAGRDTDSAVAAAVQAKATYDTAVKRLADIQVTLQKSDAQAARGQLTSAQGRLENAQAQLSYASLRSPLTGVVTDRPLFPGETAQAGSAIITVMDTSALLAKLHLAQATAQQLRLGGTADIRIPGIKKPQPATVSMISPALDPGSTTVEVWLKLPNTDGRYRVGTAVHAVIHGRTIPNAVQLPPSAILPGQYIGPDSSPDSGPDSGRGSGQDSGQDGGNTVLVIGPDNIAHKRGVTVGLRTSTAVQITTGVAPADNVVTEGGYGLDEGAKVRLGTGDGKESKAGDKP